MGPSGRAILPGAGRLQILLWIRPVPCLLALALLGWCPLACRGRGSPAASHGTAPDLSPQAAGAQARPAPPAARLSGGWQEKAVGRDLDRAAVLAAGGLAKVVENQSSGTGQSGEGKERKGPPLRMWTTRRADYDTSGTERERRAAESKQAEVTRLFSDAHLAWPPRQLLLVVFKQELELEVWASDRGRGPLTHVTTYGICSASGTLGPKTRAGDGQVPEGFYQVDYFKNLSTYYLALRINYPNARDRKLRHTGSAIMIHGHCVSIGCLAMSDERIQELWLMGQAVRQGGRRVEVYLFPAREMAKLIASAHNAGLSAFWTNLTEGLDRFQRERTLLRISSDRRGRYLFR